MIAEEQRCDSAADLESRENALPCSPELIRGEERQAQAGVHEISRRHLDRGQVCDAGLEGRAQIRWRCCLERLDRAALSIDRQDAPACPQELARVSTGATAEVYGEAMARMIGVVGGVGGVGVVGGE